MGTFTNNLLLSLLTFGESAANGFDNWGESANFNFGRLDAKLGNKTSHSLAAGDVTLSATAESSIFIELTGTLSANRVVNISDRPGFWLVSNDTAGAFKVTLLPSGGTGVEIPAGLAVVYSDGEEPVVIQGGSEAQASEVVYEGTSLSIPDGGSLIITGLPATATRVQVEAQVTGISSAGTGRNFIMEVGDGSTFHTNSEILSSWTGAGDTGSRNAFANLYNLTDSALAVAIDSIGNGSTATVSPSSFSARPISRLRFRLGVIGGTATLFISKLKVTAYFG